MMEVGFEIIPNLDTLNFQYGQDVFGPITEKRKLDDIRKSLSNPNVDGPEYVYSVAMDVGKVKDQADLIKRNLLYGAMIFSKGIIGNEPVRSQGHIHAMSLSCQSSTAEVYEIWSGEAYIYMQESANDNPGKCYAVHAKAGDVVIVPPGWAHATINAKWDEEMLFGAWCVRDYGFEYTDVRRHQGLAFYPIIENENLVFKHNDAYLPCRIEIKDAREYKEFGIRKGISIYKQYEMNADLFNFVTNPQLYKDIWERYQP